MIKNIYKKFVSEKNRIAVRNFSQKLVSPIYFGDKYYCNCCNKKFSRFKTKGNITRFNAQCPYCSSLERTRVLEFYLNNELNYIKPTK